MAIQNKKKRWHFASGEILIHRSPLYRSTVREVLKLQRGVLDLSHLKRLFCYVLSVAMKSNEIDNPGSDQ